MNLGALRGANTLVETEDTDVDGSGIHSVRVTPSVMSQKKAAPPPMQPTKAPEAGAGKSQGVPQAGHKAPPPAPATGPQNQLAVQKKRTASTASAASKQGRPAAAPTPVNKFSSCFFVTKHSWKGKYKRIFCIGRGCITTLNPQTFEETNTWQYADELIDILPSMKADNEFIITTKKGKDSKKQQSTTFSTPHRLDLLTAVQQNRRYFVGTAGQHQDPVYAAFKHHWSETRKEIMLSTLPSSLVQLGAKGEVIARYLYQDIEAICLVSDYDGGFALFHGGSGRMHLFALAKRDELLRLISENANNFLGLNLKVRKKTITLDQFRENRLGRFSNDVSITSLSEFTVNKLSPRHGNQPVQRIFATSETCIIERDPATYSVITVRALADVNVLVRWPDDPQRFSIEYIRGDTRTYLSTERDSMLATLLDSIRAAGNRNVCVQIHRSLRGERFSPLAQPPDEEVESTLLRFLGAPTADVPFSLAVLRFNMNIEYSGLIHAVSEEGWFKENKEKLIFAGLTALLRLGETTSNAVQLAGEFMAIRRLVASKAGFAAFTMLPNFKEQIGAKVVKALQRNNDGVTVAALDMLATLMQPMHENFDLGQESLNKQSLLASKPFLSKLATLLKEHAEKGTGALVINGLLDIFTFALCAPYSETTDGSQFDQLLGIVAALGRSLFHLFEHPSLAIVKSAGLVMRAIIEEGTPDHVASFQYFALAEGAILRHLHTALFTQSLDSRLLTHRQLSRHLISLWTYENAQTLTLMGRILPAGLMDFLKSTEAVPEKEQDRMHTRDNMKSAKADKNKKLSAKKLEKLTQHWRAKNRKAGQPDPKKPVTLRRRRQNVKSKSNWDYFYYSFYGDHSRADLIWNFKTREELREALENELRAFHADKELRGEHVISWNHTEFELRYETLAEEVKIGDHYLRLLLEDDPKSTKIHNAPEFFNDLYHRFLLTTVPAMKAMCLQALAVVYGQCFEDIGGFNDTEYIVTMLNRCEDHMERDRLLEFLCVLLKHRRNVKLFIDAGGLRCLVDMVTLAHLHTTRATVPLQNDMIQASAAQLADDEAEWYYSMSKDSKERKGPVGFIKLKELYDKGEINKETRVWAQGMEGWRAIRQVAQLKWTLVASGQPIMDFSMLATLCLNMMIRICEVYPSRDGDGAIVRPLPRAKRFLSDAACLPHLVQLLLTFDPIIVEKTSVLLSNIMTDNTQMSRIYQTGLFFFIMMYTGSNVLPIASLLQDMHNFQAFQTEGDSGRSVLNNMLPEALVCYLDNHGYEKFSTSFLGEFDTPEVIWGNAMRTYMIQKIALHLADFTPRLQSNTRALYQYCPVPKIQYPRLESELFCSIYYLRNLCNEEKFPNWPIKDFIQLLKDILDEWKVEVEKKPENMSMEEAYEVLGLDSSAGEIEQPKIRKAYFKMSMKFHPDKNPEGRDMFEKVNKAYEYITSRDGRTVDGPNPENIVLILRGQSILFSRFKAELKPYKYAGYPMLMETIKRETEDENLFSSSVSLLSAACELAHLTVDCSNLNAEELRRNNGIEQLSRAFQRCISVVREETTEKESSVHVCLHIVRCFTAAAQFEACREKIMELPQIIKDVCRCLWFRGAPKLTFAAMNCVSAFAVDSYLQNHMLTSGVLWHLLLRLFKYDYTLEEGGVEVDEETNEQKFANNNAKMAITCLARLGGYQGKGGVGTPHNPTIQNICSILLTPYLNDQITAKDNLPVLKLLNANSETPYLIWDNATRSELIDYLEKEQEKTIKTGNCDPSFGENFVFSAHADELVIANIFVRIYNEQPAFTLRNPREFAGALLEYVGKSAQYLFSHGAVKSKTAPAAESGDGGDAGDAGEGEGGGEAAPTDATETAAEDSKGKRLQHTAMALEALRNVMKANPTVAPLLKGHFKLIFSLLRYKESPELQFLALEVICSVIANRDCVANIAESHVLVYLMIAIETLTRGRQLAVEIMHGLCSNPKIVVEVLKVGAVLYLLDLYCNANNPAVREATASLFGKMIMDKLRGPKVKITVMKFLPMIFLDAMQDSPEASVTMFESTHENPELIWNEEARSKVQSVVKELKEELFAAQMKDPSTTWSLPADFEVVYENVGDEVVVGGVFLGLLVKQPAWVFRKPKDFLVGIMEKYLQILCKSEHTARDARQLEIVTDAMTTVFHTQKELAAQVPGLGHVHKIVPRMKKTHTEMQASLVRVCNALTCNEQGIRCFASLDCMSAFKAAFQTCTRSSLAQGMDCMAKLFEDPQPALCAQAVKCEMPQFLLTVLKDQLDAIEGGSAAKAHCVSALKAMARDLTHGQTITETLDACDWWGMYKEQRHDLFITNSSVAGYLTGPTASVAGYLMAAPTTAAMADEPPVEDTPESTRSRLEMLLGDE